LHPARLPVEELLREVRVERTRASGPGGQHRNRVATAIRLTHLPTGLQAQASERRSQNENRIQAIQRLRLRLALEVREPLTEERFVAPGAYRPSEEWRLRRRGERIRARTSHPDFPALLAEVLDLLQLYEDDVARTGRALGVSRTQLVRFLGLEPAALAALNARRKACGRKPLS